MAAQLLGSPDDRLDGDINAILVQAGSECGVVVAGDGQVWVFDDLILPEQCALDLGFYVR